ncbi:DUF5675 family protein [Parvibaculaceae bacterium PLY_AMNH_Bact1]|nr:DUF5675 family protein [Parvibaculaceae bacterium PLY_AMNH_Bact1]
MEIVLRRRHDDGEATVGSLSIDGEQQCDTLEDQWQEVKKSGETRIPAGKYQVELKPVGTSRFDKSAKKNMGKYHNGMLRLVDVPGFTEILIHTGNTEKHTAGCILVGLGVGKDEAGHHTVKNSWTAYRKIYPPIAEAIRARERVTIHIIDGDREA